MTALRVNESSGSVGVIQAADGFGSYLPTNILFNTQSSGLTDGYVLGTDVAVFVSGTMGSKGTTVKGVSLFSGDVVVSGTLYAERQVIEVDEFASGHLLVSGNLEVQNSIIATPSQILFLSGGAAASTNEGLYPDVNIFFSGSKGTTGTTVRGTALFGGDVVISGTLHGGSPLKIAGGMEVAGAAAFADSMEFQKPPSFLDGFNVSGGSGIFAEPPKFSAGFTVTGSTAYDTAPRFDAGFNVAGGNATFAEAPKFEAGFSVTGSTAYDTAPRFDAGFNVSAGEATFAGATTFNGGTSFEAAPTFAAGLVVSGTSDFVNQPKFQAGFEVTGSTAFESAPSFDAGFAVTSGQASFTQAPSFAAGFQLTGSGQVAGTINIGDPEDGTYADGLFADINQSTLLGTVIDRFNEVLKALAPSPAPALDDIDYNNTSVYGKLSFGTSNNIPSYTNHDITAGFSSLDINATFGASTSVNNLRIGVLDGNTTITGDLNEDISADTHASSQVNYPANSFGSADKGTLYLEVNSSIIHSLYLLGAPGAGLPGAGSGQSLNSNNSGFTNISTTGDAKFSDGTALDLFKHMTGKFTISPTDQRQGWNYARVYHTTDTSTYTNYIEWVNDSDSNSLSLSTSTLSSLSMSGNAYLSGVKYHTAGSAIYTANVLNAYRNIYSTGNISFTTSNCAVSSQSFPSIGGGEDHTKNLSISGNASINVNSLLNEAISISVNVPHPMKSNLSSAGSQSISGLLLWAYSNNSSSQTENFRSEYYRIKSGNYNAQSDIPGNAWDSSVSIDSGISGYNDGLIFYNSRLYAPKMGANFGDFSTVANGPTSNVNYSGINSGERTFYRYFQNNSGGSKTGFSLAINGASGTIVNSSATLNTSNLKVFIKLPSTSNSQSTGWMDLASAFSTGQVGDNAGCLEGSLDNSLSATNIVTFGTQFVADDEYIVVMVKADASFTGYVSGITVSWS